MLRHLRHTPVVVGELQGLGHALVLVVRQHEAVAAEAFHAVLGAQGARHHGFIGLFHVEAAQSARHCVGDHGGGVVAYHAVGFPAGELPDGEFAVLFVNRNHGADEVHAAFRLDFEEQGMLAAEGVPGAEHGVALPAFRRVDFAVHTPVAAVGVGVERRVDAGVVEGCVEAFLVFGVAVGALQQAQVGVPFAGGFPAGGLERTGVFGFQVGLCAFFGDAGDGGAKGHLAAVEGERRLAAAVRERATGFG